MFFYSGIIDDKGKNPIGIPYIVELTIAVSLGAAVVMIFAQIISRKVVKLDFLIFALVTFFALASSVFSLIKFNQPIIWGIIEDRRLFSVLIYFPLIAVLRSGLVTKEDLVRGLIVIALLACAVSVYLRASGLLENETTPDIVLRSETRISLGIFFVVSAYFWVISTLVNKNLTTLKMLAMIILAIIFAGVLVFIVQTRKIIIVVSLISAIFFMSRRRSSIRILLSGLLFWVLWIIYQSQLSGLDFYRITSESWSQLFDSNYLSRSARAFTISVINHELGNVNYLMGFGSLSLQWRDGFHSVYGTFFYLADVGIIGVMYRLGAPLTLLYVAGCLYISYLCVRGITDKVLRSFLLMGFWYTFLSPGAGILFYGGQMFGILMTFSQALKLDTRGTALGSKSNDFGAHIRS